MKVLVACEFSGRVRDAFLAKGHDAVSCDLLPTESPGPHIQGDVLEILDDGWDFILSFVPCTHLASSGARWFAEKRKDGRQAQAIAFFMRFVDAAPKWVIENPVGIMSTRYRKPDQIIQPWHFGHPETKATCLWFGGVQKLKPTNIVAPDYMRKPDGSYYRDSKGKRYSRIHFMSGRKGQQERSRLRSLTYSGIANAMADQWG